MLSLFNCVTNDVFWRNFTILYVHGNKERERKIWAYPDSLKLSIVQIIYSKYKKESKVLIKINEINTTGIDLLQYDGSTFISSK